MIEIRRTAEFLEFVSDLRDARASVKLPDALIGWNKAIPEMSKLLAKASAKCASTMVQVTEFIFVSVVRFWSFCSVAAIRKAKKQISN